MAGHETVDGSTGSNLEANGQIRPYDELCIKYGLPLPDEVVGCPADWYIADYGPPVVLADSRITSAQNHAAYPEYYDYIEGKRGSVGSRIGAFLFGWIRNPL